MTEKILERHYFVDEAGDLTLFSRRGVSLVGTEGCSSFFMLGVACFKDPHGARLQVASLQKMVSENEFLSGIPSLKKTIKNFHAKDDCSEVRMLVYELIKKMDVSFYVIIRRKKFLLDWVNTQNKFDSDWRYSGDQIYDACVKRVFKSLLHRSEINYVTFARRGKSSRNAALASSLQRAKKNFEDSFNKSVCSTEHVLTNYPSSEPALQIVDYGLWAIQRLFEKKEDRFFQYLKEKFSLVIDLDDKKNNAYGQYYDQKNVLDLKKIYDSL